jgi:Ser-Thr-rich glycosyl-phosphatidyl-inositol-anchored membrane family
MILRSLWLLATLTPYVFADVQFTAPEPGATIKAGGTVTIEWKDSGETPPLDTLLSYQLFLCAGGNEDGSYVRNDYSPPNECSNHSTDSS